jgi:3-methyladenine DNA glycosylase AlkD
MESVNPRALAAEIDAALAALPSRTTADIRAMRQGFSKLIASASPAATLDLALRLMERPGFEHRFIAYELVCHHRAALASLREKELLQLGRDLDSWNSVDTYACYLAGPAWREHQISDAVVRRWARSEDFWWRRTALVCTVALNNKARGGRGDTERTLAICRLLMDDREDMVVKAMSWALRELAKRDPKAVRAFLDEHRESLAPRVIREVEHKLVTGLKNPRREKV